MRQGASFSRTPLAQGLARHQIGNRMLFGDNLLRQPAFAQLRRDQQEALRVVGEMPGSDEIMTNAVFLGTFAGLIQAMLNQEIKVIANFLRVQEESSSVASSIGLDLHSHEFY